MNIQRVSSAPSLLALIAGAVLLCGQTAFAAYFPLEITAPRGDLPAQHRMLKAYPGVPYNIRAAVVGGTYPFVYALSDAPAGMTINPATGEIIWPSPMAGTTSVTLSVTDYEGTRVSQTWSIAVGTSGFRFVDAVSGSSSATGAINSPWRTLADVYNNAGANDIVYFRSGTYNVNGIPTSSSGAELRVEFDQGDGKSVMWLAYPAASPVIDFQYISTDTPRIRLTGATIYIEGFEARRIGVMGFQVAHSGSRGSIFRKMNMHDLLRGVDGSNSAFIMTVWTGGVGEPAGMVVQDSIFANNLGTSAAVKFYSTRKLLVENCTIISSDSEALALKMDDIQYTVRGNTLSNIRGAGLGGSMMNRGPGHYGEFAFNNVKDASNLGAIVVNQNGEAGPVYIYRNTFQGRAFVQNTDSADGPFTFAFNVIVNNDSGTPSGSHIYQQSVTAPSRIILSNNLVGYPSENIVDANGFLTAAYATYRGAVGHEIAGANTPSAPRNLRLVPTP
jgi:hypothetical protein